jgi:small subunit ribosomal protein S10
MPTKKTTKTAVKKTTVKKTVVKKAAVTKAVVKKAPAKKAVVKKAPEKVAKVEKKVVAPKPTVIVVKEVAKPVAAPAKVKKAETREEKGAKETKKSLSMAKQKIRVIIRAFDHKIVDESAHIIIETAERTGALVAGPIPMPTKIEKFTINKSTFVNKDAREQFEIRTHKRLIDILDANSTTISSLSNLNIPSGCDVEIKMIGS